MPEEPRTLAATGRMNLVKMEYEDAVMNFGKALPNDPHNPDYLLNLGKAYEGLTDYGSAVQLYDAVTEENPQFTEAFLLSASARSKSGDHGGAVKMLEKGLAQRPEDARFIMALGHEYRAISQFDKAIASYEKAVKLGGAEYIDAYRQIGALYHKTLGDSKKAKRYYERYLKEGGTSEEVKKLVATLD
jgi:tetratricopeptide (TPR) repeat protein